MSKQVFECDLIISIIPVFFLKLTTYISSMTRFMKCNRNKNMFLPKLEREGKLDIGQALVKNMFKVFSIAIPFLIPIFCNIVVCLYCVSLFYLRMKTF